MSGVKVNGAWRSIGGAYVNVDDTWNIAPKTWVNVDNTWFQTVAGKHWIMDVDGIGSYEPSVCIGTSDQNNNVVIYNPILSNIGGPNFIQPYLIRFDEDGNVIWKVRINTSFPSKNCAINSMCSDTSGNTYVTGWCLDNSSIARGFVAKISATGSMVWVKRIQSSSPYGDTEFEYYSNITIDPSGNLYISAQFVASPSTWADSKIIKLDSNGNLVWAKFISPDDNPTGVITPYGASTLPNGNIAFSFASPELPDLGLITVINSDGDVQWSSAINSEVCGALTDKYNNVYYVGARTIVKFDSSGNPIWQSGRTLGGGSYLRSIIDHYDNIIFDGCIIAPNGEQTYSVSIGFSSSSAACASNSNGAYYSGVGQNAGSFNVLALDINIVPRSQTVDLPYSGSTQFSISASSPGATVFTNEAVTATSLDVSTSSASVTVSVPTFITLANETNNTYVATIL